MWTNELSRLIKSTIAYSYQTEFLVLSFTIYTCENIEMVIRRTIDMIRIESAVDTARRDYTM